MIKFSREKVLLLHQLITEETGGDAGVRDFSLLDLPHHLGHEHRRGFGVPGVCTQERIRPVTGIPFFHPSQG